MFDSDSLKGLVVQNSIRLTSSLVKDFLSLLVYKNQMSYFFFFFFFDEKKCEELLQCIAKASHIFLTVRDSIFAHNKFENVISCLQIFDVIQSDFALHLYICKCIRMVACSYSKEM